MTEDRHQRLILIGGVLATLGLHASLLAGLAIAGEWRVLRFLANFITQLDAPILITIFCGVAITYPRQWRLVRWVEAIEQSTIGRLCLRVAGKVIVVDPDRSFPPVDFRNPRERFETIGYRLMFCSTLVFGLAVLVLDGWDKIYAMLIALAGFLAVAIAFGVRAARVADQGHGPGGGGIMSRSNRRFQDAAANLRASFADWFIHGPWPTAIITWPMLTLFGAVIMVQFPQARQGPLLWVVILALVGAMSALSLFACRVAVALCRSFRRHP